MDAETAIAAKVPHETLGAYLVIDGFADLQSALETLARETAG